jgi:hypothetical protein
MAETLRRCAEAGAPEAKRVEPTPPTKRGAPLSKALKRKGFRKTARLNIIHELLSFRTVFRVLESFFMEKAIWLLEFEGENQIS